ncbi:DUF1566 domain-containing protein [Campylobacter rectus]|uniref:Lcl C-terminal domain-containing protein n=1 Tax=Campylobacter rectus TaxID=203 RepID=UPI0028E3949C|nr:DUF1566 domain-containing protein [Campylobacter rectus]
MKKLLTIALAVGLCFQLANAVKFGSILKDAGTSSAKATAKVSERQSEVESRSNEGASSPQVQETQYGKIDAKFWYGSQVVYSSDDSDVGVILTVLKPIKATGGEDQGSWDVTIGSHRFGCNTDDRYEKVGFDVSGISCSAYKDFAKKVDIKLLSVDEVKIKITSKSGDIREETLKQKLHVPIFKGLVCQKRKYNDEGEAYECHEDMSVQYPLIKTADLKEYAERMIEDFVKTDHGFFCSSQGRTSSRNVYYVYKDMVLIGNYDHYDACGTAHPAFESQIYIGEKEIPTSDIVKNKVGLAVAIKKHIADNLDKYGYDSRDNERLQEIKTVKDKANIKIVNDYFIIDQGSIDTFYLSNSASSDKYTLTYQEVEPYLTDGIKGYFKNAGRQNLDQNFRLEPYRIPAHEASAPQNQAPVTPQSNSQILGKKYKFNDGFSIDVNSGIVLDAIYGLMWQDAAEIFKGSYKDAVSYCENLNHGGYSDWRLPSASELLSITDYGRYKSAINKAFKHVGKDGSDKYGSYWSSTGASFDAGGVWVVQFGSGFDNWVKINSADNFARCVRNLK